MQFLKKFFILYFYLKQLIETHIIFREINNQIAAEEKLLKENTKGWFLKLVIKALITSNLVFLTVVFLHQGSVIFKQDGSTIFNKLMVFELTATFVFLLMVFLVHRGISSFINLKLTNLSAALKYGIEALLVILTAVLLLFLLIIIPFNLVFPEIEVDSERVRLNYIFMAILALFFYYFGEREQSKRRLQKELLRTARLQKESYQAQLQHLRSQMNPHFLFNSLNVLATLIKIDQNRALKFVQKLSEVYRAFLQNSEKELISLHQELKVVKAYNYLLKTRFGDAIEFKIDIPETKKELYLPPGTLQTLIENAVKHNGATRKDPLIIEVFIKKDQLVVSNKLKPRKSVGTSSKTGLTNITNRYKFLADEKTIFEKNNSFFTAKVPLLKLEKIKHVIPKSEAI